ncbi:biotin/lipoyl-containing protein [Plebeiibacterium marinum]|uniref:Acetyl-CoA carboxylase biotin carboxyl carrier protein subunit n=1 Tax=Plebeiibacterium marinum TaxID=2992111 RepID=A0AAE3MD42_9BACT|nr:biotin/lipoyl-containing protein [Plebeiobacterium marinum]MCW3805395.1 acetyl-CoA carboxylase biotin carboxyl carrier protein subunit [Plebeiobacterium marinum]
MKKFEFTIAGNRYNVEIKDFEDSIAQINVNGTAYEVEVHQEVKKSKTPKLVRKPVVREEGEGAVPQKATGAGAIKAPLPGNIFKVNVAVGDTVAHGDVVIVMEAMKMENNVLAVKGGVVKSVKVAVGDSVLQNDILIEFE